MGGDRGEERGWASGAQGLGHGWMRRTSLPVRVGSTHPGVTMHTHLHAHMLRSHAAATAIEHTCRDSTSPRARSPRGPAGGSTCPPS